MVLRPGQCWVIRGEESWFVAEFLGWRGYDLVVRKWLPTIKGELSRLARLKGAAVTLATTSVARGDSTGDTIQARDLGHAEATRVILSKDRKERDGLTRTIVAVRPDIAPLQHPPRCAELPIWKTLEDTIGGRDGEWEIYVDGSWRVGPSPPEAVLFEDRRKVHAGAGLVIVRKSPSWHKSRAVLIHLVNGEELCPGSAYPMELLALVLAQLVRSKLRLDSAIFSDCEAALKALRDPDALRYQANTSNLILLQTGVELQRAYHVRSHPERYEKDRRKWNRYMYGNYLADRVSVGDYEAADSIAESYKVIKLEAKEVMDMLTTAPIWYWTTADGRPTLRTYEEIRREGSLKGYLRERDEAREERDLDSKWDRRSVKFAADVAHLECRNAGDRTRLVRINWDYYMHGVIVRKFGM